MDPESNITIRAAALDLDGTIIGPDERITPGVKDAVARLAARIPVFIATGREPHDVFNYARQLGLTGPQLSDGGAAILDPVECKHIWSANLGPELAPDVLALVEELKANFVATHLQGTFRRISDIPDWDIVRISALDLSREAAEAADRAVPEPPAHDRHPGVPALQRPVGGGLHAQRSQQGERHRPHGRDAGREAVGDGLRGGQLQRLAHVRRRRAAHRHGRGA